MNAPTTTEYAALIAEDFLKRLDLYLHEREDAEAAALHTELHDVSHALSRRSKGEGGNEAPNPEYEAKAAASLEDQRTERGPVTRGDAEQTLVMLRTWTSDAEPANELGQVSFSRAMLESAEDALAFALAASPAPPDQTKGGDASSEPAPLPAPPASSPTAEPEEKGL